ncbi:hypothetical protein BS162P3_00043 [Bacteroides phage BS162P3]|nr:hypothetical protein BS162P3_00043 [Bacteroides phage BS162P3]
MNAREKDLLKYVGKSVIWKGVVVNSSEIEAYETNVSKCVGYSLSSGRLIVAAHKGVESITGDKLDPVFDVVVYPRERYLLVNPNNVEVL